MDVKLNPVRCKQCEGTKRVLSDTLKDIEAAEPFDPTLEIPVFVDCPGCNGLGFTYEMSVDAVNMLKLFAPRVKGTATFRPPQDKPDVD